MTANPGASSINVIGNQVELMVGPTKIVLTLSTTRKVKLGGFQRGSFYDAICIAVNSAGMSPVSNTVNVMAP